MNVNRKIILIFITLALLGLVMVAAQEAVWVAAFEHEKAARLEAFANYLEVPVSDGLIVYMGDWGGGPPTMGPFETGFVPRSPPFPEPLTVVFYGR